MTLSELRALTQMFLQDEVNWTPTDSTQNSGQAYSGEEYTAAINSAIKLYCQLTGASYKEESAAISTAGLVTLPADNIGIRRVYYGGVELVESTIMLEGLKNASWRTTTATTTKRWVPIDGVTLQLTPLLSAWSSGSPTCTIGFVEIPAKLSADGTSVDTRIIVEHQEYLKYPAAAYLRQASPDQNSQALAASYIATFKQLIGVA